MYGVLTHADALVMVTSANPDGAEGAAKQMDWLAYHRDTGTCSVGWCW